MFESIHGGWLERFVTWKRRSGRVKESSLQEYVYQLGRFQRDFQVDLEQSGLDAIQVGLDRYHEKHNQNGFVMMVGLVKDALGFLKRRDVNDEIRMPARQDRTENVREQIIPEKDLVRLIKEAPNLRDRLMIELFLELGSRRGEMANLRIKDVQFDEYSAVLTLTGKTGVRSRRVYDATPDLRAYLNNHPRKEDPFAPLLFTVHGTKPLSYEGIYQRVKVLSQRILGYHVNPHRFRHTKATLDSRLFTDRELMMLNGWTKAETVNVYSHLSMRDVDDKDLVLHGLKSKEEILRPIMQIQHCSKCKEENAPVAIYCNSCGATLANKETQELRELVTQQTETIENMFSKENIHKMVEEYLAGRKET
jgi:integrase